MTTEPKATTATDGDVRDRLRIQRVLDEWVFSRDNGEWEALRAFFSTDGRMTTNVGSFSADEFVNYARAGRDRGLLSHHVTGPSRIRLRGDRAIAETQGSLNIRTYVHDVEVDITAMVRYSDRLVLEADDWKFLNRLPVYLLDRMQPVRCDVRLALQDGLLAQCPIGARFLVYRQLAAGGSLPDPLPITFNTPESDNVFEQSESWLGAASTSTTRGEA